MSDTNETIADIIAEMRALSNPISDGIIAINGRIIADRLEAAHRRERGDAAKLRNALNLCVDEMCARCRDLAKARGNPLPCLNGCEPVRKAKAALAAPVRNCDVMDWRTAWKMWREKFHPETPVGYSAVVKGTEAFMDWFTAPRRRRKEALNEYKHTRYRKADETRQVDFRRIGYSAPRRKFHRGILCFYLSPQKIV